MNNLSPKKVLSIVLNDLENDNRVLNQAYSLVSKNYHVTLLGIQRRSFLDPIEKKGDFLIQRLSLRNSFIQKIKYVRGVIFLLYVWSEIVKRSFNNYDIIHCHDLNTLQFGCFIKVFSLGNVKLIYDAHEYETQRNGLKGIKRIYVLFKEPLLIKFCDRVITVSNTIAEEYKRLYDIEKPAVILNCPLLKSENVVRKNLFREKFQLGKEKRIFLYQGYLSPGRGIEVLLDSFEKLNRENLILVLMGEGILEDKISQHESYGSRIFMHPFVSGQILLDYTSSADYGIAFIEDISLSDRFCLPNKLFEYIAAGLPVLGSGLPDLKQFINVNRVGVTSDSNDIEGFIKAIDKLLKMNLDQLQENIHRTRLLYNWQTQEKVLLNIYLKIFE